MFGDRDIAGAGLSPAAISSLFVLWSVCSFVFEIPTGILADRVPRRPLLLIGPLVTAAGFALWTWWPSYAAFAAGFVLWSAGSALRSGTMEALVYDTLAAHGLALRYAQVAGRMRAMSALGVLLGTMLAVPLAAWGGYHAAGAASVVACVICAGASWMLPEDAPPGRADGADADPRDSDDTDNDGITDSRTSRTRMIRRLCRDGVLRRLFVLVIALTWVEALDEYLPLLAAAMWGGASTAEAVALLMVVVAVGDIGGGFAAERTGARRPSPRRLAPWLLAGAVALAAGAASGHPAGIVLVAFAFGVFGWSSVMAEAMMQDRVPSRVRATVTSVVGVGEEVVAVMAFGSWALGSQWLPPTMLFALAAIPYVALGVALVFVPGATTTRASARCPNSSE
ncbi:MFS transporter [Gordonia sp. PKS22-38]|uniref:MFS transporter n=1 Tax=Gordonia prachuapensis TaxID=3115651 RepID=A0ABU7MN97_9ACTN|nr:MFS transporter [Gordonia sp. PKS22-38]